MLTTLSIVIIYLFFQMFVTWIIAEVYKNPSIIDVVWPIGLIISGLIFLFSQGISLRNFIIAFLLIGWGMRLASYLFLSRICKGIVDKRYLEISKDWKISKSLGFLINFQIQGLFILLISISFLFIAHTNNASWNSLDTIGLIVCITGIIGETIADKQLQAFKSTNPKLVCNTGLWNYSRHPNLFFDWLTWCGFFCFALSSPYGIFSIISPLCLYFVMTKLTIPITENGSIQSRGDLYKDYQKATSAFFPMANKG